MRLPQTFRRYWTSLSWKKLADSFLFVGKNKKVWRAKRFLWLGLVCVLYCLFDLLALKTSKTLLWTKLHNDLSSYSNPHYFVQAETSDTSECCTIFLNWSNVLPQYRASILKPQIDSEAFVWYLFRRIQPIYSEITNHAKSFRLVLVSSNSTQDFPNLQTTPNVFNWYLYNRSWCLVRRVMAHTSEAF